MSDSSVISSSQKSGNSGGNDTNSAFADAVQRARQLAAKIHSGSDSTSVSSGTKRPLEDNMNGVADGAPDVKKTASNDSYGGVSQRNGGSDFIMEEYKVPDKMVGLIIGRGGEQITRLQSETGCKIQLAPESDGTPERPCTLSGTREAVQQVKEMINQIISKANSPFPPDSANSDGQYVAEMMIPGPKVGLLIGKGGENIRNLQEKGGVKMVLIQDGPQQTTHEKPLRITGDPQKVEFAKQMVADLLAQKDLERSFSHSNGSGPHQEEIMVPRQAVGVVIGKGGDMIKRIQQDSGTRVQFIQGKEDIPGDKLCQITGSADQVQKAGNMIRDLIQSVLMGGSGGNSSAVAGRGRGRGRGGGFAPGMGGPGMRPDFGSGPRMGRPQEGVVEIQFAVPANKCGLVIGKGGETVRSINQQSGAHVEIAKGAPPNLHEKIFIIRGNPQQIEHAKQLISERVGALPPGQSGQPGGPSSQGPPGQFQPQYPQQFPQPAPGQAYAAPGWGNAYQPWPSQPAAAGVTVATSDPTKAAADANAAAWAAYYTHYYQQPGQPQPTQIQPQPQAQPQPQQPNVSGAQPDYSAAWVEYYRSLGMFKEADMIEQQARGSQAQQVGQQLPQGSVPGVPVGVQPVGGAPSASQPQQSQPPTQVATSAAPTGQTAQPPAAHVGATAWAPTAYAPQPGQPAQVSYGQPNPYPGYGYAAAYAGQQQFAAAAPQ